MAEASGKDKELGTTLEEGVCTTSVAAGTSPAGINARALTTYPKLPTDKNPDFLCNDAN